MSQNDFSVANADGATVRADINSALQALASQSSGDTAPGTTYPFQIWVDTTNAVVKQRDATNTTWLSKYRYGGDGPAVDINYGGYVMVTTSGAANVYAAALSPSIGTPRSGQVVRVVPHQTNTGAATFNANSYGELPIRTTDGNALVKNEIQIGRPMELMFYSPSGSPTDDHWILLNPCDDEFTWTPTLIGSSTAGTQTYALQIGRGLRRGKNVWIGGYVAITAKDGAMAGNAQIGGQPYAASSVTSFFPQGSAAPSFVTLDAGYTQFGVQARPGESVLGLIQLGTNITIANVPVANLAATAECRFSVTYLRS